MYERILDSFREDQIALDKPADFTDKRNDLETKFKKEEIKKGDKQIKKDMNEWEDLYEGGPGLRKNEAGITKLADKINKMMRDSVLKSMKKHTTQIATQDQQRAIRDTARVDLEAQIKKRKTLEFLCSSIFKKNHDLYLQHETMLDEERKLRSELAENFQSRMA